MPVPSVFMAELTDPDVAEFIEDGSGTVLVPAGSTEQHGPHAPLSTDVIIPQEVARRVALQKDALVAPPVNYGISAGHRGFRGLASLRPPTFVAVIEDLILSLVESGFREVIFINGHYTNYPAINMACFNVAERLPQGVRAWAVSYWDALPSAELEEYLSLKVGLHANIGETSCVLAVRPELVHLERAVAEWPDFPEFKAPPMPTVFAYFETNAGSVFRALRSGVWGDPRDSSAERGERYYQQITRAVCNLIDDVRTTYERLSGRG